MAQVSRTPARSRTQSAFASMMILARWRIRRTWGLLVLTGIGMLAAVTVVCTVPLYSEIALTAGLRGTLNATPQSAELTIQGYGHVVYPDTVDRDYQELNAVMQQQLGAYLQPRSDLFIHLSQLNIAAPSVDRSAELSVYGAPIQEATQHLQLVRGRLPQAQSPILQIAITQQTATYLHVDVGAQVTVDLFFVNPVTPEGEQLRVEMPLQIAGIIVPNQSDAFWDGQQLDPTGAQGKAPSAFSALMATDGFLYQMQQLSATGVVRAGTPFIDYAGPLLYWHYHLNVSAIGTPQLDDLIGRIQATQAQLDASPTDGDVANIQFSGAVLGNWPGTGLLDQFQSRLSVVTIPVTLLLLQVGGLILFFVSMMASLLVERQAEVIALLRSRGASHRHIFGVFAAQGVALAGLSVLVGPWLALLTASLLVKGTLSPADQQAQNVLAQHPLMSALPVGAYTLVAAVCVVGAMLLSIWRSTSRNVLEMRREATRSTRQPFWQRLYLDVIAVIIALTGFLFSLYVNTAESDTQTAVVVANPLALVAPTFLVIAGLLLFLRFFPRLLESIVRITSRRPAAAPMLAVAQIARAPRLAVQMILLLALSSGFASFALIFMTSETQHLQAVAAYEVGADFSGIPVQAGDAFSLAKQTAAYRAIPGVTSATLGYVTNGSDTSGQYTVSIQAVDAATYAQTAIWTDQDSSQPVSALLQPLIAGRSSAIGSGTIPAVVDQLTWQRFHLHMGMDFLLGVNGSEVSFRAVAEATHLPGVADSLDTGSSSDTTVPGGVLIDYPSLASVFPLNLGTARLPVNTVWLRTSDDPAVLTKIRAALTSGPLALNPLLDRRANLHTLEQDPLYLALLDVLILGTAATLLLALVGDLLASWLSARTRLTNFAVLRALGTTPGQLASMLTWEQGVVYATAIVLGAAFGAVLAGTMVPALVFTGAPNEASTTTSGSFYNLQQLLPTQIVVPSLLLVVFAALVVICALAIGLMARVVSRPSLGQTLRLNAD
ncbi:MAG TPA: FtsX-like permease family protein [Ktedonobacterales bacterium]|nr:FtsX-like permease family protein [Ktedonobacterales bacterium]